MPGGSRSGRDWSSSMPRDLLVIIFSFLSMLDRLNNAAAVCRSWRTAAGDPSLAGFMDLAECRRSLGPSTSPERAGLEVAQALAQGVKLGGSNLITLILDGTLKLNNKHFFNISLRCPNLQTLKLPFPNGITNAYLSRTFGLWKNLHTLHIPLVGSLQKLPVNILKIIGSNCRSLTVLKLSGEVFGDKQISTINNFMPGLRILCVRCAILDSKLVKTFSENASLEEVYLSIIRFRVYPWLHFGKLQMIVNDERRPKGFPEYRAFHLCRWELGPCGCMASELDE